VTSIDTTAGQTDMSIWNGDLILEHEGDGASTYRVEGHVPVRISFSKGRSEHLAGLGERFVRVNQTGQIFEGRTRDLFDGAGPDDSYYMVPVVYSSAGYAVLVETYAPCVWDLGASDGDEWSVWVPESKFRVHVFVGTPKRLVRLVSDVNGRAPLAQPWVYGVWKTALSGSDAILRQGERLSAAAIPVTALWTYDYFDGETNSGCGLSGSYPSGEYPDMAALIRDIHSQGYRALGYMQPVIVRATPAWEHASAHDFLVRKSDGSPYVRPWWFDPIVTPGVHGPIQDAAAALDFTNPDAANWYTDLVRRHVDLGWDGWMEDFGEDIPNDARFFDGTTGRETHNRYATLYHQASHAGWQDSGVKATFSRSGSLGSIRHQTVVWPGDQYTDWTPSRGLRSVIPAGMSAGLVGASAWGPDIFGLTDWWDSGAGAHDEELWIRACQFGALSPIMRDHGGFKLGGGAVVDLWTSQATRETFRSYADLHVRLNPYFWQLAMEAADTGVPIMRAMFLEYPEHDEAWAHDDQYLLGEDLLVAPVHRPGEVTRKVWMPPGEWADWWTNERHEGPRMVTVDAPLDQIPLFQRAGSSIPMLRVGVGDPTLHSGVEMRTI